jgi:hypothetical protein
MSYLIDGETKLGMLYNVSSSLSNMFRTLISG